MGFKEQLKSLMQGRMVTRHQLGELATARDDDWQTGEAYEYVGGINYERQTFSRREYFGAIGANDVGAYQRVVADCIRAAGLERQATSLGDTASWGLQFIGHTRFVAKQFADAEAVSLFNFGSIASMRQAQSLRVDAFNPGGVYVGVYRTKPRIVVASYLVEHMDLLERHIYSSCREMLGPRATWER